MYGIINSYINSELNLKNKTEIIELKWWGIYDSDSLGNMDFIYKGDRENKEKFSEEIKTEIISFPEYQKINSVSALNSSELNKKIITKLNEKYGEKKFSTCFGYFLLQRTYNMRCDLFHGDTIISLFKKANSSMYVRFTNIIFSEYIAKVIKKVYSKEESMNIIKSKKEELRLAYKLLK